MTPVSTSLSAKLEVLCQVQATDEEIASHLGCSVRTIERLKTDPVYAGIFTKARADGKISLRRAQWRKALKGDTEMLIWLGKQYLGQREPPQISGPNDRLVQVPLSLLRQMLDNLSEADFLQLAEENGVELPAVVDPPPPAAEKI